MAKLDPERWRAIGPHLDQALEMPPTEREAWLSSIAARAPQLAADLRSLVNEHEALAQEGFLEHPIPTSGEPSNNPELPTPSNATPRVGTILGRYKLVRKLDEGGWGTVFEATHQDLGRRAAIKILHQRYAESTQARLRFLREGQAASRIRHSNVAAVYDVGTDDGHPFLVMELLEGEDLSRLLARERPLSVQRTADLMVPVVAAVAAAHEQGIVHRDLKPGNIFLSAERSGIRPKVLDFGISKVIDTEGASPLTDTGTFLGTLPYVSPEQAQGAKHIDIRSDQYSLGVILYECATGRKPVEDPSIYTLVQKIVRGDFAPPRQINSSVPIEFEDLILRAMARDPGNRFPTTSALGRALLEFASAEVHTSYASELATRPESQQAATDVTLPEEALKVQGILRPLVGSVIDERYQVLQVLGQGRQSDSATAHDVVRNDKSRRRWVGAGIIASAGLGAALAGRALSPRAREHPNASPLGEMAASALRSDAAGDSVIAPNAAVQEPLHKTLLSDPPGAFVWRDGAAVGKTPLSLEIPTTDSIEVELRLAGYESYTRQIGAADPEGSEVRIQLKPQRSQPRPTVTGATPAGRPELAPR